MKSIRTTTIAFSMISIPIRLGTAVGSNEIELHQYGPDNLRIRQKTVEASTGKELTTADIKRGYETPDGSVVFLVSADFEAAYGKAGKSGQILMFTDASRVPAIAKAKPYLVEPDKGGERVYALLVRSLQQTGKVAIIEITLWQRMRLAVLSATEDGYLMLEQLTWAADLRKPDFPAPVAEFAPAEEKMAIELIDALTGEFSYESMTDSSREKLNALIMDRIKTGQVTPATGVTADGNPVAAGQDLLAALAASLAASKPVKPVKAQRKRAPRAKTSVPEGEKLPF